MMTFKQVQLDPPNGDTTLLMPGAGRALRSARHVCCGWYWRLIAEYETISLWLAADELTQAEAHARLLVKLTLQTSERTFQALAWSAMAQVRAAAGSPLGVPTAAERQENSDLIV